MKLILLSLCIVLTFLLSCNTEKRKTPVNENTEITTDSFPIDSVKVNDVQGVDSFIKTRKDQTNIEERKK